MSRQFAVVLALCVCATSARAQDEDLLVPLAKPKAKPKPKPVKRPVVEKPAANDDELVPLTVSKGEISVRLKNEVRGARLFIDDRDVGLFPAAAQSVTPGEHTVVVRRPGFAAFKWKGKVLANKTVELNASLEPTGAVLTVLSDVPGAAVFLNGRQVGLTPIESYETAAGAVELAVRKDGREDTQTLRLEKGKDFTAQVKLAPAAVAVAPVRDVPMRRELLPPVEHPRVDLTAQVDDPPVYKRWYFWTGVVVVVAAAAVGTGLAVSHAQAPHTLTSNEICGGACDGSIGAGIVRW